MRISLLFFALFLFEGCSDHREVKEVENPASRLPPPEWISDPSLPWLPLPLREYFKNFEIFDAKLEPAVVGAANYSLELNWKHRVDPKDFPGGPDRVSEWVYGWHEGREGEGEGDYLIHHSHYPWEEDGFFIYGPLRISLPAGKVYVIEFRAGPTIEPKNRCPKYVLDCPLIARLRIDLTPAK
jgi:hypothetical protein